MKRSTKLAAATLGAAGLFVGGFATFASADTSGTLVTARVSDSFEVTHGTRGEGDVECPSGKIVTGGGFSVGGGSYPGFDYTVEASVPGLSGNGSGNGWTVALKNFESSADITVFVHAVCATAS